MIAKGNLHCDGVRLLAYILDSKVAERAELGGARGFDDFGADLRNAAVVMQHFAMATTRAESPWFHTQTRLAPGEHLTREQWEQVFEREGRQLGFRGLPCAWSYHIDIATGEMHTHCMWFRIDIETGEVRDPGLFKLRLMEVARKIELEFGLRIVGIERQPGNRAPPAERKELEESRRLGTDGRAIRNTIVECLEQADGGRVFKAMLEENGLMLANGDHREAFVVVDQAGGHHALNRKLTGLISANLHDRLADLDRSQLLKVKEAQLRQRQRGSNPGQKRGAAAQLDASDVTNPGWREPIGAIAPSQIGQHWKCQAGRQTEEMQKARVCEQEPTIAEADAARVPKTTTEKPGVLDREKFKQEIGDRSLQTDDKQDATRESSMTEVEGQLAALHQQAQPKLNRSRPPERRGRRGRKRPR
jgi:hypothetical protein